MTEVPEHLLQRSAQARAKATGAPAPAPDVAPTESAAAPAVIDGGTAPAAAAAAPAEAPPEPPKPDAPWVAASNDRQKIPAWVMPVLLFLPIWAFMYVGTLEDPPREEPVLALGGEIYEAKCASCHGAEGGGGTGPAFTGGAIIETFPDWAGHIEWVVKGTDGFVAEGREIYGANETGVGSSGNKMPAFGADLNAEELTAVIFYERIELGGYDEELEIAKALFEGFEGGEVATEEFDEAETTVESVRAELGEIVADLEAELAELEAAAG